MDSKTRLKEYINQNFPNWEKVDFAEFDDNIDFKEDFSDLYKIDDEETILISYTNISITGTERPKPQLRVFLDEYKKPFYFAKKHQLRYFLFSIFTKEDEMARGLNNFNPKEYVISIETNLDNEGSRRDLRSIYDYANEHLRGRKFLKCTRSNYKVDINEASFIYIGTSDNPETTTFEAFINIFDSRPYIKSKQKDYNHKGIDLKARKGELKLFLSAIKTKPFLLLAGISGTGKSRIVRKLAQATVTPELQGYEGENFDNVRWTLHAPANFELIQVKPNWHNSMDVVGYLSNIPSPHYVFTPFVQFIAKAWQHTDVPFFLCLDEMNLAPVEEYFAEFLSAIESRSFEDSEYTTDPIIKPFVSFGKEVCDVMINTLLPDVDASKATNEIVALKNHFKKRGFTLPKNLIVVGTVNMDETTFSFSRKVLDRAMSIEMNEVDYDRFLDDTTDDDIKTIAREMGASLNSLLVDRHIEAKEVKDALGEDTMFVIDYLKRVNALLEGTPFKLGYRVANEALIYLRSSQEFGQSDRVSVLDNFTLMKILSRIEGDENKLRITHSEADKERLNLSGVDIERATQHGDLNLLTALRDLIDTYLGECYLARTESTSNAENELEETPEGVAEHTSQTSLEQQGERLKSIKKIDNMLSQLEREHFVTYWN